jgi:hypothetical protein
MAEYGEWNRKGATLSDVTAKKEYGVGRNFIVKGTAAEDAQSSAVGGDAESVVAKREPERPAVISSLMEAVCERA